MKLMFEVQMEAFTSPNDFLGCEIDENGKIPEMCNEHCNIEIAPTPLLNFNTVCDVLKFFVEVTTTVGTGLLVNWLWDLIKEKKKIKINKINYEVETKEDLNIAVEKIFPIANYPLRHLKTLVHINIIHIIIF